MPGSALFSALGFPGWGALHLILEEPASPELLQKRLRPLAEAQRDLPPSRLLPLLLDCLDHPAPWPPGQPLPDLRHMPAVPLSRCRLVCRAGAPLPLRLRLWQPPIAGAGRWRQWAVVLGADGPAFPCLPSHPRQPPWN